MKMVFLDRDGVVNEFPGVGNYVTKWEEFRFIPKAREALALLTKAGFEINIISNQGCVAHGLITLERLQGMTNKMLKMIETAGGKIGGVFYCIHQTSDQCECKKPKTALFREALHGRNVGLESAYFIGDSQEDMQAGVNIGCKTLLVLTGRTKKEDIGRFFPRPDIVKEDLWEAAHWIIQEK